MSMFGYSRPRIEPLHRWQDIMTSEVQRFFALFALASTLTRIALRHTFAVVTRRNDLQSGSCLT